MTTQAANAVQWQIEDVTSPQIDHPVSVVVARDVPYYANSNRLQTLTLYLPCTDEMLALVGTAVNNLPTPSSPSFPPRYLVHLHGGAWRDPHLNSTSIEPMVAHAFDGGGTSAPISLVASINYTVSQFPTHPALPYDSIGDNHSDPARDAVHPQHVSDTLQAFALLRSFGLTDHSYVLSGHSAGACIAFQSILQSPQYYGLSTANDAPCPAAILGLNGLYDLPDLVYALGASHEHLRDEYERMLSNAFGREKNSWSPASPARFDPAKISERVREGKAPSLVRLDQSMEDQLVPMIQLEQLRAVLAKVDGMQIFCGDRCTGKHAAPWEQGLMLWDSVKDVLQTLRRTETTTLGERFCKR